MKSVKNLCLMVILCASWTLSVWGEAGVSSGEDNSLNQEAQFELDCQNFENTLKFKASFHHKGLSDRLIVGLQTPDVTADIQVLSYQDKSGFKPENWGFQEGSKNVRVSVSEITVIQHAIHLKLENTQPSTGKTLTPSPFSVSLTGDSQDKTFTYQEFLKLKGERRIPGYVKYFDPTDEKSNNYPEVDVICTMTPLSLSLSL